MILDATAGNRTMWSVKNADPIVYIDIEKRLEVKPTIYADNTQTPFQPHIFDTIFYDPPHTWEIGGGMRSPYRREVMQMLKEGKELLHTYYGWDKYKTRRALISHMYNAQREFKRILKPDGLLLFKWNEISRPLQSILQVFNEWYELMRLYVKDPTQTAGKHQTYWVILCKKEEKTDQLSLMQF